MLSRAANQAILGLEDPLIVDHFHLFVPPLIVGVITETRRFAAADRLRLLLSKSCSVRKRRHLKKPSLTISADHSDFPSPHHLSFSYQRNPSQIH